MPRSRLGLLHRLSVCDPCHALITVAIPEISVRKNGDSRKKPEPMSIYTDSGPSLYYQNFFALSARYYHVDF